MVDGDRRAFGRSFENALGAFFRGQDPGAALFTDWGAHRVAGFEYKKGETWDRLVHQGIQLLERFAQDDRIRIHDPQKDLQIKIVRNLPEGNEFLGYVDAIGELDGTRCIIDWKTTGARHPDAPEGLLSLDPQLICYSWLTGISEVAFVVFVRKHYPEIQYLRATISEEQRIDVDRDAILSSPEMTGEYPDQINSSQSGTLSGRLRFLTKPKSMR